jgi:hypothetical protein
MEASAEYMHGAGNMVFGQTCPVCKRAFAWPSTMVYHVLSAHGTVVCDYAKGFHNEFYIDNDGRIILEEWCDGDEEPIDTHRLTQEQAVHILAPKLSVKEWTTLPKMVKEAV